MLEHIEKNKREINEKTNATIDDIVSTAKDIEQLNEDIKTLQAHMSNGPKQDDFQNIAMQIRDVGSENEVRLNNAVQSL